MSPSAQTFEQLFRQLYPELVRASSRICGEQPLAEDVVQQVFVTFWERGGIERAKHPAAYLRRSVITRTINALRDRKKLTHPGDEVLSSAVEQTGTDNSDELADAKEVLRKSIASLPERARVILILHRFEGLSYKEIAAELEIAPKTVENQLARALKLLRGMVPRTLTVFFSLIYLSL